MLLVVVAAVGQSLSKVVVTPAVVSMETGQNSMPLTITVYDDENNVVSEGITITVEFNGDTSDGKQDVATYNDDTKLFTPSVTEGHGNYTVTATSTSTSSTVSTDIEVFVYNPNLTIEFKIGGTTYSTTGTMGDLRGALASKINGEAGLDSKTYLDITDLTVSGNINDKDIRVIREMAGATATTTENTVVSAYSSTGNLSNLNIQGVKFVATLSYANNVENDATEEEKIERENERMAGGYVVGKDVYTGDGSVQHPGYITTGGYISTAVSYEATDKGIGGHEILPSYIFDHCKNLTSVTLPNGIKQFGNYCFNECTNLTTVDNYSSVIDFGQYAFSKTALTSFDFTGPKANANLKTVAIGMFRGCQALTSVTMPETLRKIDNEAFRECPKFNLSEGHLPNDLTDIGEYAFWKCTSLSKAIVPVGVTAIAGYVFELSGLQEVELKSAENTTNTLTSIGYRAFTDCKSLTNLSPRIFSSSLQSIDSWAFAGCDHIAGTINLSATSMTKVSSQSFGWMSQLTEMRLPDTITEIEAQAFQGDGELATFALEDYSRLTRIGGSAFLGCSKIKNVFNNDQLENVESIGESAFKGCTLLQSDEARHLMHKLTKIEAETFAECTSLTWLSLGESGTITEIGPSAFRGDVNVNKVTVYSAQAPTCYTHYDLYLDNEVQTRNMNPFEGLAPNKVLVEFASGAASGWESYRADMEEGTHGTTGAKKGNGFMYLLTKVMRETGNKPAGTDYGQLFNLGTEYWQQDIVIIENNAKGTGKYDVVDQPHADVILERTIGLNWNTIMLPFTMDAAHLAETFNGYSPVVAKYGWNDVYVKQQEGETDVRKSVLQFETVNALAANTPYIFLLVNQQGGDTKTIDASVWKVVNVDIVNNPGTTVGGVDGYAYTFTGSYDDQANIVSPDHGILYINSKSSFSYKLANASTTTRMKGFRAYFTFTAPQAAGAKSLSVSKWDDFTVTGIDEVVVAEASAYVENDGPVYNLHGYKVADSRQALIDHQLPKGIYIFNGKKVTVK